MDDMFLCPQGDIVYTDNPVLRGGAGHTASYLK